MDVPKDFFVSTSSIPLVHRIGKPSNLQGRMSYAKIATQAKVSNNAPILFLVVLPILAIVRPVNGFVRAQGKEGRLRLTERLQ
jgi:hypothetical protein